MLRKLVKLRSNPISRLFSKTIRMSLTEDEWRLKLNKEQFKVLRQKGTERAFSGQYENTFEEGTYHCVGCDAPLYKSNTKFHSGCGWPAFFDAIPGALKTHEDTTFGMKRIEIVCAKCDGHLGHIFKGEGFKNPTDERHCVNSVCLNFKK
jgi:peptide-methionine (R)-S-oxide reductase